MLNHRGSTMLTIIGMGLLTLCVIFLAILVFRNPSSEDNLTFHTPYQAVLLSNGWAYFGKIEKMGPRYIEMTDVYYVQSGVNPETKAVTNILIKRGKEWHAPDRIALNLDHVLFIEPVGPDSTVAKLIEESKKK
ncbi:hypothetical protein HYR99_33860 [Candidatus Poribacteria bacterium]|nr:hypothetical protein [Candidatus Poribacteria bacterium]